MRWEGQRQSDNVEDRRRMSPRGMAIGGGGALITLIVGLLLGFDPNQIAQLLNNPQGAGGGGGPGPAANEPESPEEIRSLEFAKTILAFTSPERPEKEVIRSWLRTPRTRICRAK